MGGPSLATRGATAYGSEEGEMGLFSSISAQHRRARFVMHLQAKFAQEMKSPITRAPIESYLGQFGVELPLAYAIIDEITEKYLVMVQESGWSGTYFEAILQVACDELIEIVKAVSECYKMQVNFTAAMLRNLMQKQSK
jgi:hypothetical protein